MLEIKNASITIGGRQLFAGLSFTVPDGQTVCLTGSSGSGKTTLLRAILGFHQHRRRTAYAVVGRGVPQAHIIYTSRTHLAL